MPCLKRFDRGIKGLPIPWKVREAAPEYLRREHRGSHCAPVPAAGPAGVSASLPLPSTSFWCFSWPVLTRTMLERGSGKVAPSS